MSIQTSKAKRYMKYKGRVYELKWQGTKPGDSKVITKLAFLDGSREFWAADGEPLEECKAPSKTSVTKPTGARPEPEKRYRRGCGAKGCTGKNFCQDCDD
jgi:hypothetical protein